MPFNSYDTIDEINCQIMFSQKLIQKEAAINEVKEIDLNQIKEVEKGWFVEVLEIYEMFKKRL